MLWGPGIHTRGRRRNPGRKGGGSYFQAQFHLKFRAANFFISRKQVCLSCRVLPPPSDTGIHREDPLAPPGGSASLHACPQTGHAGPLCEVLPVNPTGTQYRQGRGSEAGKRVLGDGWYFHWHSVPLKNHTHRQHENRGSYHRKKALCFLRNVRLITQGIFK
jgi:hypothetical protein